MAASDVGGGDDGPISKLKALPSAWSKIVRGDLESISVFDPCSIPSSSPSASDQTHPAEIVVTENSVCSEQISDEQQIKAVWKKLCNGGNVVIGGDDKVWPDLLESSKISSKEVAAAAAAAKCASSASSSSSKSVSNVSTRVSQKQVNRSNPSHTSKHGVPSRSKPTKRSNGSNGGGKPTQSVPSPTPQPPPSSTPPPPPPFPAVGYSHGNFPSFVNGPPLPPPPPPPGKLPYTARPMPIFPPILPNGYRSPSWRPRANGPYHSSPGPRRFERSQSSNGRDLHMHHQIPPQRGFMPHVPPGSPVLIPPPPVRSFTGPMAYNDIRPSSVYLYPSLHPKALRNMHFYPYTLPHPVGLSPVGPLPLPLILVSQVEYYFSDENLAKDKHLKLNMDEQGWVPIAEIANFPRIKNLTNDIHAMEEVLKSSVVVEVKEGKIRRRNDWNKYVIHTGQGSTKPNSQSHIHSGDNELATSLQSLSLEEDAASNQITVESPANDEGV